MNWNFGYLLLAPFLLLAVAGCDANSTSPKTSPKDTAAKDSAKSAAVDLPGLKELDEADRKLAARQRVCPVSGELLGTADMGKPYKMTVQGRTFFLCCKGCVDEVNQKPDAILKKLDDLMAAK